MKRSASDDILDLYESRLAALLGEMSFDLRMTVLVLAVGKALATQDEEKDPHGVEMIAAQLTELLPELRQVVAAKGQWLQ